jgi:SET domain-containing protein
MKAPRAPQRRIDRRFARFRMQVGRSAMHRYGVFALEDIPRGRRVIEYTGKRLTIEQVAKISPPEDSYIALIKPGWFVDGRREGSGAELMNHSCQPNLEARRVRGHLLLFSRRRIRAGEELTWNYHYPIKAEPIPCRCGARRCRGTLRIVLS